MGSVLVSVVLCHLSVCVGSPGCLAIEACCYFYLIAAQSDPNVVTSNITVFDPHLYIFCKTLDHSHSLKMSAGVDL